MGAEGKLPPKQRKRKRSLAEPSAPGSDPRGKGKATATVMPRRPAAKRVSRQQPADGPADPTAASRPSDAPHEAGSTPTPGATAHVCGHC